ncbi:hypothetical protein DHD80_13405 [Gramella sp. AN32]|nr:hypothetical protein [Gramella sp. AN32]
MATWLEEHKNECEIIGSEIRLGSPIKRPSKIVCVGLNYVKHAEETGGVNPKYKILENTN